MNIQNIILRSCLVVIIFLCGGCAEKFDKTLLHGNWQVDQFLEADQPKNLDISKMGFSFNDQNVYTYQSNLKYREAGNYRIEGDYLYSTDTLNNERVEKVVQISYITKDTLHLTMNNGGITQKFILHKLK